MYLQCSYDVAKKCKGLYLSSQKGHHYVLLYFTIKTRTPSVVFSIKCNVDYETPSKL